MQTNLIGTDVVDENNEIATIRGIIDAPQDGYTTPRVLIEWTDNGTFGVYNLSKFRNAAAYYRGIERKDEDEIEKAEEHQPVKLKWYRRFF
jgi:hypothetical protein